MMQGGVQALAVEDEQSDKRRSPLRSIDGRKPLEIEAGLRWAYREQLPKEESPGRWTTRMQSLESLGTMIDQDSINIGFPMGAGAPHDDALKIDAAVQRLPELGMDWALSRPRLMPDLLEWVAADDGMLCLMSFQPAALLMLHARMATRPRWNLGATRVACVFGKNGKPLLQYLDDEGVLIDGRTTGRHYGPGARCPLALEPPAREIARARAEYAVWHAALCAVAQALRAWNLRDHRILPPVAAPEPWIADTEIKSRILRSNRTLKAV